MCHTIISTGTPRSGKLKSVKWEKIVPLVDATWDANAGSSIKKPPPPEAADLTLDQIYQGDNKVDPEST